MNIKVQKIIKEEQDNYIYIFIFGDSHCLCFGHGDIIIDNKYNIQMLNKDSSSARGLINENSTLKYGCDIKNFVYFKKGFGNKPFSIDENNNYYMFKFGQVDVQINYYYKIIIKKENIDKLVFFLQIINDYITYLKQFENYNIIVCGIQLPNPVNYKKYLINCFNNINEISKINEEIEKLKLEEMNDDTLLFNSLLKKYCENNKIKYFDLTNECTVKIENNIMLLPEYIGDDHHYKGCKGLSIIENNIKIYNEINNNNEFIDYINHQLYNKTYYTFLNKLKNELSIEYNNYNTNNIYNKNISVLYLLDDINNLYFFHNNIIKYSLIKNNNEIIINIDEILTKNNKLDENMKIFGMNVRGIGNIGIINLNIKIELESNLPIKIFTGKKWINYDTNIINDIIYIENINKWRISISNNYMENNFNKKNEKFIVKFIKLFIII